MGYYGLPRARCALAMTVFCKKCGASPLYRTPCNAKRRGVVTPPYTLAMTGEYSRLRAFI